MKSLLAIACLVALATGFPHQNGHPDLPVYFKLHGKSPANRIVGGEEVVPHSKPHQVGLWIPYEDGRAFCGGSIIAENWVLTAAHCGELSQNITVIAGAHNITNTSEPTQQIIQSDQVIVHPNWDSSTLENDIALVHLISNLTFNEYVKAINLPGRSQEENNFAGVAGTATGWGITSDGNTDISETLNQVTTTILSNAQCRIAFGILGALIPLHPSNVCADGKDGKSTCSGDSGGPLTVLDNHGEATEIGLTSYGVSLGCEAGYPAVFTRLTSFIDWLALTSGIPVNP